MVEVKDQRLPSLPAPIWALTSHKMNTHPAAKHHLHDAGIGQWKLLFEPGKVQVENQQRPTFSIQDHHTIIPKLDQRYQPGHHQYLACAFWDVEGIERELASSLGQCREPG